MNTYFRCLESRIDKNNTLYGKFSLNSILSGQGNTFANSLRRSLFSDLSGLAITHFCITSKPGLGYEFATLPGLSESVLDFSLNLKKVVLTGRVIDHEMQKITTLSSNLNNVRNTDYLFHSKRPLVPFEPKAQLRFQSPTYLTEGRSAKAQNIEGKSLSKHSKASIVNIAKLCNCNYGVQNKTSFCTSTQLLHNADPQRFVKKTLSSITKETKGRSTSKRKVLHVKGTGVSRLPFYDVRTNLPLVRFVSSSCSTNRRFVTAAHQVVTRYIQSLNSTPLLQPKVAKESTNKFVPKDPKEGSFGTTYQKATFGCSNQRTGSWESKPKGAKQQKTSQKISSALPMAPIGFLKAKGPAVLRAKDLILPPGIRCVHPNQYLGTLAADGALSIKFLIAAGKGFIVQDEILYNSLSRAKLLLSSNGTEINNPGLDTQAYPSSGDAKRKTSKASLTYFKKSKKSTKVSLPYPSINGIARLTTKGSKGVPVTSFGTPLSFDPLQIEAPTVELGTSPLVVTRSHNSYPVQIKAPTVELRTSISKSNGFIRSSVAVPCSIRKEHLKAQLKINFGLSSLPTGKAYLQSKQLTGMLANHTSFGSKGSYASQPTFGQVGLPKVVVSKETKGQQLYAAAVPLKATTYQKATFGCSNQRTGSALVAATYLTESRSGSSNNAATYQRTGSSLVPVEPKEGTQSLEGTTFASPKEELCTSKINTQNTFETFISSNDKKPVLVNQNFNRIANLDSKILSYAFAYRMNFKLEKIQKSLLSFSFLGSKSLKIKNCDDKKDKFFVTTFTGASKGSYINKSLVSYAPLGFESYLPCYRQAYLQIYLFHSKRPKAQLGFQSPTYLTEGRSGKTKSIEGESRSLELTRPKVETMFLPFMLSSALLPLVPKEPKSYLSFGRLQLSKDPKDPKERSTSSVRSYPLIPIFYAFLSKSRMYQVNNIEFLRIFNSLSISLLGLKKTSVKPKNPLQATGTFQRTTCFLVARSVQSPTYLTEGRSGRVTKGCTFQRFLWNQRMWSEKVVQESKKQSGSSLVFTDEYASNVRSKHGFAMYLWRNNRAKQAKLARFYPSDVIRNQRFLPCNKSTNCHYAMDTKHQTFKKFLGSCGSSEALTNTNLPVRRVLPSMLCYPSCIVRNITDITKLCQLCHYPCLLWNRSIQSTTYLSESKTSRFVRPMGYIATKDSVRAKSFDTKRFKKANSKAKKQINNKPSQTEQSTGLAQSFLPYGGFTNTVTVNSSKKLSKKQLIWGAEENFYPVLPLDVTFTPISKVNFQINVDRNSEKNEETIIFEIWTNGSITPKRAIQESCLALAQDFYNLFCHVNEFSSLQFWWKRESIESKVTRSAIKGLDITNLCLGFGSNPYFTSKKQLPVYLASHKKESSQITSLGSEGSYAPERRYQEFKQNTTYKGFPCKKETLFMLNQGLSLFNRFILYPTVDHKSQMNLPCSNLHPLDAMLDVRTNRRFVSSSCIPHKSTSFFDSKGSFGSFGTAATSMIKGRTGYTYQVPYLRSDSQKGISTLPTANNLDIIVSSENQTTTKKMHSQVKNSTKIKFPENRNLKLKQKVQYLHAFWRLNVSDLNLSLRTQLLLKKLNINSVYDLHFFILKKSWSLFLNSQQQKEIIKIYLNFGLNSPF